MSNLEVTPEEFSVIHDRAASLPDSEFARWMIEHFGDRCPDLRYGLPTEVHVVGPINVKSPRSFTTLEVWRID